MSLARKRLLHWSLCGILVLVSCGQEEQIIVLRKPNQKAQADLTVRKEVKTIAFGSCANPTSPMPALRVAVEQKADLFIWLGDNVYGDTKNIRACSPLGMIMITVGMMPADITPYAKHPKKHSFRFGMSPNSLLDEADKAFT
jgi:hypothetical protein